VLGWALVDGAGVDTDGGVASDAGDVIADGVCGGIVDVTVSFNFLFFLYRSWASQFFRFRLR